MPSIARAQAQVVRIGLPTKTYYPTIIAETALRQKLFDKEGIKAELTIYRGGAEVLRGARGRRRRRGAQFGVLGRGRHPQGRDGEQRRGRGARLLRLAPRGEDRLEDPGRRASSPARRSASRRPARAPTSWRCGRRPTARSPSRACRSAAAAWCRTCSPAISTRGDLLAAQLQAVHREDRAQPDRLRRRGAAEHDRRLDVDRQVHQGQAAGRCRRR